MAKDDDINAIRKLMSSHEYIDGDPQVRARVSAGFKRLYSGKLWRHGRRPGQ